MKTVLLIIITSVCSHNTTITVESFNKSICVCPNTAKLMDILYILDKPKWSKHPGKRISQRLENLENSYELSFEYIQNIKFELIDHIKVFNNSIVENKMNMKIIDKKHDYLLKKIELLLREIQTIKGSIEYLKINSTLPISNNIAANTSTSIFSLPLLILHYFIV